MMTADTLHMQFDHAKPGQVIEYHIGFLMDDREADLNVHDIANTAYYLACHQGGWLFQRRYGENVYGYLLVKSTLPRVQRTERWVNRWLGAKPESGARE